MTISFTLNWWPTLTGQVIEICYFHRRENALCIFRGNRDGILALCLDGLSAFSAEPGEGVLWLSVAVPFVVYYVAANGLYVRMQGAVVKV